MGQVDRGGIVRRGDRGDERHHDEKHQQQDADDGERLVFQSIAERRAGHGGIIA